MAFNWGGAGSGAISGATAGSALGPWGAAAGGVAGGLLGGFTGNDDPEKRAKKYLDQIMGMGHDLYDPYINQGKKAGGILEGEYGKMLNPTDFINSIMGKYSESEGAKYERDKLGRGIGATAAAGGIAGTPEHQRSYGEMADKIMSGDMQQFLENALNVHGRGLTGEENFYNKGYGATSSLADVLGGALSSKAGLGFHQGNQNNQNSNALMQALSKLLTTYAGSNSGQM